MERSQVEAVPPERIRYRLTRLQRLLTVLPIIVVMACEIVFSQDGGPVRPVIFTLVMCGVLMPMALLLSRSFGVTLTPSAAIVHNLRRRTVPWSNVQAIQVDSLFGSRTVVLYEAGGRRTRLRAPITGFLSVDRGFEEKFHTIGRWWLDHRGPDWTPVPPPGARWSGPLSPDGSPYAPPA